MNAWSGYPFLRVLVPYIAGILICHSSNDFLNIPVWLPVPLLSILVIYLLVVSKTAVVINQWYFGGGILITIAALGYTITSSTCLNKQSTHFSYLDDKADVFMAQVIEDPHEKEKTIKLILKIPKIIDSKLVTYKTRGKIICYLKKDSLNQLPSFGDILLFSKKPVEISNPKNPGEFNYKEYLANNGVFHTLYLKPDEFQFLAFGKGNLFKSISLTIRKKFIDLLKENGLTGKELPVAAAMLSGYGELLDPEQRQAYASAGIIHILCVSGLHVGIIFLLAEFAFSFFQPRKRILLLKPVLIILVIWLYASITGLAPPVMRASLMFTIIIFGRLFERQSNALNSLAASAFLLLLYDPLLLFNVGFQLSYSAVAGVLLFQGGIRKFWNPRNPLLKGVWNLTAVSISAQVFTAPLAIYYFHQFPVYFIFANLAAIPLAGIIIYTGLAVVLLSIIPLLAKYGAAVLISEIKILNTIVSFFESLPGAVSGSFYFTKFDAILLLLLLSGGVAWLISSRKSVFFLSFSCFVMLLFSSVARDLSLQDQRMIVIHHVNKHPVISFINNRDHLIYTDSLIAGNAKLIEYEVSGLSVEAGLKAPCFKCLSIGTGEYKQQDAIPEFFNFFGKRLVIIAGSCQLPDTSHKLRADYVILCCNPEVDLCQVASCFPGARLIADASNNQVNSKRLKEAADENQIHLFDIKKSGALLIEF